MARLNSATARNLDRLDQLCAEGLNPNGTSAQPPCDKALPPAHGLGSTPPGDPRRAR